MSDLFLSHSTRDDAFVRALQQALLLHGVSVWIDSRELSPNGLLEPEIIAAIDSAAAYAVLVSPDALQSRWVGKELRHALAVQRQRGRDAYPVFVLSLDGTKLGVLEAIFEGEPLYIAAQSAAGGVEAVIHPVLVALGKRLPTDFGASVQPPAEPLEELVLELSDLKFVEPEDGVRRASARARLVYEPAASGLREVKSEHSWRFVAPIGPIEAGELRWYLEQYAVWPSHYFAARAGKVEASLVEWGRKLYDAALPGAHIASVLAAWARIDRHAGRRFSVHVDAGLEAGAAEAEVQAAREAATVLLGLPWELLHDGRSYLFQGASPSRVRRRLPNTQALDVAVLALPIRILLVSARPEDEACGYLDHRVSARPLVAAMEALPGLVQLTVLSPATLPALAAELARAQAARTPYHVLHFDGHGVYDRRVGLGGLCFEDPQDHARLERRRHVIVHTPELGALLREHRIPLVFLEACQSAQAAQASESVASELLRVGVASVVAMSHSVLVETARRFVEAFYQALAAGRRVGDAMLAGQRALKDDPYRGRIFGAGELRLDDWFVPVLFQEKDDPQLFRALPAGQTKADHDAGRQRCRGHLPPEPETGFIGRSRELLALERLLRGARYAVLRGQGGEGKTALAAEFARWMLRSQQIRRAAFVSVESHGHAQAVLDALGRQLVGDDYSVAAVADPDQAMQPVERALREQPTLLVIDNMESLLLPPFMATGTPAALTEDAREQLTALLALCARLLQAGETRLLFTSREALPAPFAASQNRRELHRLDREDAVKLVERVLDADGSGAGAAGDAAREAIEQLVDAVHGHARTLALLAPTLRARGVAATQASLVELMATMERRFPGSREQSVFASVELSLQRMSPANRERARVLGVFQGGVQVDVLVQMMQWQEPDVASLAGELIETGLATENPFSHLTLNPALCPYLRGLLDDHEYEPLRARWVDVMWAYVEFLVQQQHQHIEVAATLTQLELPNLFALLEQVQHAGEPQATIALSTSLHSLLQALGKPRLLARAGQVRDAAAAALGDAWSRAQFEAARTRIEQQLGDGHLGEAFEGAQRLLQRARAAGEQAYPGADYDLAAACWLSGRVLEAAGQAQPALPLLDEARRRFEAFEKQQPGRGAQRMASVCLTAQADCLRALGRFDEAATAYEESLRRDEQNGAERDVAVGKGQLGSVRLQQGRYPEALAAYNEARQRFTALGELGSVATAWHQIGRVHQASGQADAAEDAYRQSLAIKVQLGDAAGQARTLNQLGSLYGSVLQRPEEAASFHRQAADQYERLHDEAGEGRARSNLANSLRRLGRLDEARQAILRAIECDAPSGHAAEPWKTFAIRSDIETDAGNAAAAAQARTQALDAFLAYRRDGGENHDGDGRLALAVRQALQAEQTAELTAALQQLTGSPQIDARTRCFIDALLAIAAGSRDRRLAEAPGLFYTSAAEILLLLEALEAAET